jgi:beta-1,4-mannooligosaccharide/beta-1,4-mannosyl-N-acetylglucosamine phosphorylase
MKRYENNPVLSASDVPYPASLTFNAGVERFNGRYVMVFRNDYGPTSPAEFASAKGRFQTNIGLATSDDGLNWIVEPKPIFELHDEDIHRAYDPRITVLDGRCYMCFAVDTAHGVRGGLAVTDDLHHFEILSLSAPENRNMVLFPQRVNGHLARFERPFPMYLRGGREDFDIWYAESPDGRFWGEHHLVLGHERVPYANGKIGPAAPPLRVEQGWLAFFHAVEHLPEDGPSLKSWEPSGWRKRYTAGLMLLDVEQPWKVLGISPEPVHEPDDAYPYEIDGFRGSVIFPCGMLREDDDTVRVYYGAADTVVALATASLSDLLDTIQPLD